MSLLDILYPPTCMACQALLEKNEPFCNACSETFSLLPAEGHCVKCFAEISELKGTCKPCRKVASPFRKLGACFDSFGPGKSLLNNPCEKEIASFLLIQLERLNFPPFDLLTTLPSYFSNPFAPIAKELASLVNIPYIATLEKKLTPRPLFSLKKKCNIINKVVLLLHTEMIERDEIRSAGWALKEGLPEQLFGLTFCATSH
ncbi:MAG: double zinc ribbon domain-containing protein [Simkaniaceae bacterium]|nr:double zinc ribbon domain-containing protein [Candidatus Sacchlamyda saccharinae]